MVTQQIHVAVDGYSTPGFITSSARSSRNAGGTLSQEKAVQEEHMRRLLNTKAIVILVLAFPIAAWADVSGTPTLAANLALNLDTGATTASGGDILWNGSTVTPQGNATAVQLGYSGAAGFDLYLQSDLETTPGYSKSPIIVLVGTLFAVKTNGGNYAKV